MRQEIEVRLLIEHDGPELTAPAVGEGIALLVGNFGFTDGQGHRLVAPPGARSVAYNGGTVRTLGTAKVVIRPTRRHGGGFLLLGEDCFGRGLGIFAKQRATAEHIREVVRSGRETTVEDWAGDR